MSNTGKRALAIGGLLMAAMAVRANNLLYNGDFSIVGPNGNPVTSTALFPGPCAADGWEVFHNQPNTVTTTKIGVPGVDFPSLPASPAGGNVILFDTNNFQCEMAQVFKPYGFGPKDVTMSAWVYVLRGVAGIGAGHGGNTGYEAWTDQTNQWIHLTATHHMDEGNDEFIIGNAGAGAGIYYFADAHLEAVPEPCSMIALGGGLLAVLKRRKR